MGKEILGAENLGGRKSWGQKMIGAENDWGRKSSAPTVILTVFQAPQGMAFVIKIPVPSDSGIDM